MAAADTRTAGATRLGGKRPSAGRRDIKRSGTDRSGPGRRSDHASGRASDDRSGCPAGDGSTEAGDRQTEGGLGLVLDLPEGWRPPTQAASTLLQVLIAVHSRRHDTDRP
jgi:hypothetical protein